MADAMTACFCGTTYEGGVSDAGPTFVFYRDAYGGTQSAEAFAECLPSALRVVRELCGGLMPSDLDADSTHYEKDLMAWGRAVCVAVDAFAEYGEGRVGGFTIGKFSVTNYMEKGTTGLEVAQAAAISELSFTGWTFSGAGR